MNVAHLISDSPPSSTCTDLYSFSFQQFTSAPATDPWPWHDLSTMAQEMATIVIPFHKSSCRVPFARLELQWCRPTRPKYNPLLTKRSKKEWWQKCSSHVEEAWLARKCTATCCQPWQQLREIGATWYKSWHLSWVETRTYWTSIIERTAIRLCISRHEAAEVHSPEEHRHAETNPTCKSHEGHCASHQNSRPKSFVRINLPRWTSWA